MDLSSNDYLSLANHPALQQAAIKAIEELGTGAGGSRLLSGDLALHHQLEARVAQFKGDPAPVTRVVLDLSQDAPYHVTETAAGLEVSVGQAPVLLAEAAQIRHEEAARTAAAVVLDEPAADEDGIADAADPVETATTEQARTTVAEPSNSSGSSFVSPAAAVALASTTQNDSGPSEPAVAAPALSGYDVTIPEVPVAQEVAQVPLSLDDMGLDVAGDDYVLFDQEPSYQPQGSSGGLPAQFQPTTISGWDLSTPRCL